MDMALNKNSTVSCPHVPVSVQSHVLVEVLHVFYKTIGPHDIMIDHAVSWMSCNFLATPMRTRMNVSIMQLHVETAVSLSALWPVMHSLERHAAP
jgi:hypothetical protein